MINGHMAANGFWHPGKAEGCPKCGDDLAEKVRRLEAEVARLREKNEQQSRVIVGYQSALREEGKR